MKEKNKLTAKEEPLYEENKKIDCKKEKRIKELKRQLAGIYDEINNITRTQIRRINTICKKNKEQD